MINQDFAKWAVGYSGFIGGNPLGNTWLCGIEDTGGDTDKSLVFCDASEPGSWVRGAAEFLRESRFNQRATKLLMALKGLSDFKRENLLAFLEEERCFCKDSDYFKLNLYPIAFAKDSTELWMPWLETRTGLANKDAYWQWCAENRFPVFRRWVREVSPKIIICTGVTYGDYFFKAFADGERHESYPAGDKRVSYSITNEGKTLVAVTYFLGGRHGLNSDKRIRETGAALAELSRAHQVWVQNGPNCNLMGAIGNSSSGEAV